MGQYPESPRLPHEDDLPPIAFVRNLGDRAAHPLDLPYLSGPQGQVGLKVGDVREQLNNLDDRQIIWLAPPRQNRAGIPQETFRFVGGRVILELARHELLIDGQPTLMQRMPYRLTTFLAQRAGVTVTREALSQELWGQPSSKEDRTLDVHVLRARKALGDFRALIKTVKYVGFMIDDIPDPNQNG